MSSHDNNDPTNRFAKTEIQTRRNDFVRIVEEANAWEASCSLGHHNTGTVGRSPVNNEDLQLLWGKLIPSNAIQAWSDPALLVPHGNYDAHRN